MRGLQTKKIILICLSLFLCILIFSACGERDKEITVAENVSEQVKAEENEINERINDGSKYLSEDKYDDAKKAYEKAISIDTGNKNTYLKIKDNYLNASRLDDALYIIKLAIINKVDTDNMETILKDLKSSFEITMLQDSVYEKAPFTLPTNVTLKINNVDTLDTVKWNTSSVDTNNDGTYNFKGTSEKYERPVELVLTVKKIVKEKKIGYVKKVYESNDKKFLEFDTVEFFEGNQAIEEAKKDGYAWFVDGEYVLPPNSDGYFRNPDNKIETFEISNKADFILVGYNSIPFTMRKSSTYNEFKTQVNSKSYVYNDLCNIYIENGIIVNVEERFHP